MLFFSIVTLNPLSAQENKNVCPQCDRISDYLVKARDEY